MRLMVALTAIGNRGQSSHPAGAAATQRSPKEASPPVWTGLKVGKADSGFAIRLHGFHGIDGAEVLVKISSGAERLKQASAAYGVSQCQARVQETMAG
jgi:hypothetical protein